MRTVARQKSERRVVDILKAIRNMVPAKIRVGLGHNSVHLQSRAELKDCIEQVKLITAVGVDFIEVSGGIFENPTVSDVPDCGVTIN